VIVWLQWRRFQAPIHGGSNRSNSGQRIYYILNIRATRNRIALARKICDPGTRTKHSSRPKIETRQAQDVHEHYRDNNEEFDRYRTLYLKRMEDLRTSTWITEKGVILISIYSCMYLEALGVLVKAGFFYPSGLVVFLSRYDSFVLGRAEAITRLLEWRWYVRWLSGTEYLYDELSSTLGSIWVGYWG